MRNRDDDLGNSDLVKWLSPRLPGILTRMTSHCLNCHLSTSLNLLLRGLCILNDKYQMKQRIETDDNFFGSPKSIPEEVALWPRG